jgi:hypothetical protein
MGACPCLSFKYPRCADGEELGFEALTLIDRHRYGVLVLLIVSEVLFLPRLCLIGCKGMYNK